VKYWYKIKELDSDCNSCDYKEDDENGWKEGKLSKDRKFKCFKVYLVVIKAKDKCGNVSICKFKIIVKKEIIVSHQSHIKDVLQASGRITQPDGVVPILPVAISTKYRRRS
jgi:hypothetical protein